MYLDKAKKEEISCQHHLVHERRLAVVYVSNNCNVSNVLHISFRLLRLQRYKK